MKSWTLLLVLCVALIGVSCSYKGQTGSGDTGVTADQGTQTTGDRIHEDHEKMDRDIETTGDKIDRGLNRAGQEIEKGFNRAGQEINDATK